MPDESHHVTNIYHGKIDARGASFGSGSVHNTWGAENADLPQEETVPARFSGHVKRAICIRLLDDWPDLADELNIPIPDRSRFEPGREAAGIWEWLEQRDRLGELRRGLLGIDRSDLVRRLDDDAIT
ncbi:hypothetical protein AB0M46_35400 [Dactylosporangium sp. NPDC051485]|uniref:hypothetical protein n=1 Tax=Dactylosporangium sp. NPDC051485 TaxID=3154846 RepID=UPI00344A4A23